MSAPKASTTDLINMISQKHDIGRNAAEACVRHVLEGIKELAVGQKLILRGFGTFEVKHKAARTARNVHTGLPVDVPARDVLTFKAAKAKA